MIQKKAFTTFFAEGNTTDPWDSGKPQKLEFERGNSRVWNHAFLTASAAKKFTLMPEFYNWSPVGTMPLSHVSHSQINVKFDFWPNNYTDRKFRPLLPIADFSSETSITIKRKTVGDCKLLACDGKVRKSRKLKPKSKILILYPKQPKKYGADYVGGAHL